MSFIIQYDNFGEFHGFDLRRNRTLAREEVGNYATDVFTDEAVRLIKTQSTDQPLFLYLAHLAVHTGNWGKFLEAPQSEINKFRYISEPNRRTYAGDPKMFNKLSTNHKHLNHPINYYYY